MKKIEEYLPLYIGSKFRLSVPESTTHIYDLSAHWIAEIDKGYISVADITLILRPLSSLTQEEKIECDKYAIATTGVYETPYSHINQWASRIDWFLKNGFDLFNLHESGLCIYESDLKKS